MDPVEVVEFPSSRCRSRCAGLYEPPAGGGRDVDATYELSAGSFHWAHKNYPASTKTTTQETSAAAQSVVIIQKQKQPMVTMTVSTNLNLQPVNLLHLLEEETVPLFTLYTCKVLETNCP